MKRKLLGSVIIFTSLFILAHLFYLHEAWAKEEKMKLKLATNAEKWLSIGKGLDKFAELVNLHSKGKIDVEVFYSGALGSEGTAIRNLLAGTVEMANCSDGNLGAFTVAFYFMNMPFVFQGTEGVRKVVNQKWVRDHIDEIGGKSNLKQLMFLDNGGPRHIQTTKKKVKVPADMKGLKIRTTASKVEVEIFKQFGALPTPINWDETYTALGQGTVDGEGIQHTWTFSTKHYEVIKYVCENGYVIGTQNLFIRRDLWNKLPKDVQEVILKAAQEAEAWEAKVDWDYTIETRTGLLKKGVEIYTPNEEEMKLWRAAVIPSVWNTFKENVSMDFLKKIQEIQK